MKYKKASPWLRLIAFLIDALIFAIPSLIVLFLTESEFYLSNIVFYAYFILMEASFQKTFGKHIMGLKVVKTNGGKPTFTNCFWRNAGKYISAIPYGYGFLRILAPHHVQTIHDELARCFVVNE